ncbi:MAG TPA: helix-hairpin-helix domain-containing protein [Candidatus Dormibacteraeota bacterium]|nr:helix-hairpin-helix domain-containing protein [Candidatus Dormibacteraeota bacterium]
MHRLLLTALLTAALAGPLDINTADEAALRAAGFTASQAAQIVGYRGENGAFLQVDELLAVPQVSRAALAPLREKLTIGNAPPAASAPVSLAPGGPTGVQAKDVTAEWRNLYGVVVYAVNGSLENGGAQPLHAIRVRVDLLDRDGAVVATRDGYNLGAEALLEQPDTAIASLPAVAPGNRDPLRMTIDKAEIPRPFTSARLTIVEAR